jgi:hypothetical protein
MQPTATMIQNAPMVRVPLPRRPVPRKSISELLDDTRLEHPAWYNKLDDSRLHIAAAADFNDVVELISTAPCERLAGYVEGLYVNN